MVAHMYFAQASLVLQFDVHSSIKNNSEKHKRMNHLGPEALPLVMHSFWYLDIDSTEFFRYTDLASEP